MKAFTNISKSFAGRFKRWGGGEQVGHAFWSSVPEYFITPKIEYIFWTLYLHFISPFRVFLKYKTIPTAKHVFDFYISSKKRKLNSTENCTILVSHIRGAIEKIFVWDLITWCLWFLKFVLQLEPFPLVTGFSTSRGNSKQYLTRITWTILSYADPSSTTPHIHLVKVIRCVHWKLPPLSSSTVVACRSGLLNARWV